ncbi:hypothetical protein SY83_20670 [Paenibacillus swuensis]|uniref:DUF3906 domain-containing protein n=1 Tax=Paenibacillus swuensis TaxID=1178515 RepID=A0A172TMQ1_9BACL|nr:DUF3906 family protein [Paenibacillus swuensis]ANE48300.1 hypothetical protein SY83_20670 [Paenibacillus swuensis]
MYLYKLEVELPDQLTYFVVIAETDEKAFEYVEPVAAKYYIATPEMKSVAIVEKKRMEKGTGYVIETGKI